MFLTLLWRQHTFLLSFAESLTSIFTPGQFTMSRWKNPPRERPGLVVHKPKVRPFFGPRVSHFLKVERVVEPSCSFVEADVNRVCFQRESVQ